MSIGTTIKKLRRERNMTQEQLAELLGLSINAVSQWECDKTAPDIANIPMLASIFEVSADVLLEIDIAKNKKQAEIKNFIETYQLLHSQGHMIFHDGDFGFWHDRLARISFFMACDSMRVGEHDRALRELEQTVSHLEGLQNFTSLTHTSLLVRGVEIDQRNTSRSHEETLAQSYLRYLNNQTELFAPVSEDARFADVKKKMALM